MIKLKGGGSDGYPPPIFPNLSIEASVASWIGSSSMAPQGT
ncbi:hypothetical protein SD78_1660 [Bacillus badius]|nr:hypothetical protein SD78_1660 [Bacillus badius]